MERPLAETHPRLLAIGQCDPLGTPPISAPMGACLSGIGEWIWV